MVRISHVVVVSLAPTQAAGIHKEKTRSHIQRVRGKISARRRKGWKRWTIWSSSKMLRFGQVHREGRARSQELGTRSLCRKTAGDQGRGEQS